ADAAFASAEIEVSLAEVLPVAEINLASAAETSGLQVGRFLTVFLFLMALGDGAAAAIDIVAGEKERGTLETLLATPAGRREIVAARQLTVLAAALAITRVQVANLLLCAGLDLIPLPGNLVLDLAPAVVAALLVLYLPLAALV